jgi:hypothetical protein
LHDENRIFRLELQAEACDLLCTMTAPDATAEVFVTAFKSLKRRRREAVLERMLADDELSEDWADTLALESRRREPRHSFRQTLQELHIEV